MRIPSPNLILVPLIVWMICQGCATRHQQKSLQKIAFSLATLDANGLRHGEASVDYEYCIPATPKAEADVRRIDPDVHLMKASRGRVGCVDGQWLCISSTHHPDWRKRLHGIAALPFVEMIIETQYE